MVVPSAGMNSERSNWFTFAKRDIFPDGKGRCSSFLHWKVENHGDDNGEPRDVGLACAYDLFWKPQFAGLRAKTKPLISIDCDIGNMKYEGGSRS